jgi:hypothetical protein
VHTDQSCQLKVKAATELDALAIPWNAAASASTWRRLRWYWELDGNDGRYVVAKYVPSHILDIYASTPRSNTTKSPTVPGERVLRSPTVPMPSVWYLTKRILVVQNRQHDPYRMHYTSSKVDEGTPPNRPIQTPTPTGFITGSECVNPPH